jgi:DNA repair exonuclease SbcCD ATPase subunit
MRARMKIEKSKIYPIIKRRMIMKLDKELQETFELVKNESESGHAFENISINVRHLKNLVKMIDQLQEKVEKYEDFYIEADANVLVSAVEVSELKSRIEELEKDNERLRIKNNKLIKQMEISFENDELTDFND